MFRRDEPTKWALPSAWLPSVEAAVARAREQLGAPASAIAVTYVDERTWQEEGSDGRPALRHGLAIWLLVRGKTVRYRAAFDNGELTEEPPLW